MRLSISKAKDTTGSRRPVRVAAFLLLAGWSAVACNEVLGLSDYVFSSPDASSDVSPDSSPDASLDASPDVFPDASPGVPEAAIDDARNAADASGALGDATGCDVALASQCYPCAPTLTVQFLNACTSATCVPFDDSTRVTHLLADGALPPLPAGNDAGPNQTREAEAEDAYDEQ